MKTRRGTGRVSEPIPEDAAAGAAGLSAQAAAAPLPGGLGPPPAPARLGSVRLSRGTQRPSQIQGARRVERSSGPACPPLPAGEKGLEGRLCRLRRRGLARNRGVEANNARAPLQGPILLPLNPAGAAPRGAINSLLSGPVFQRVLPILKTILSSRYSDMRCPPALGFDAFFFLF